MLDRPYNSSFQPVQPQAKEFVANILIANRTGGDTNGTWGCDAVFEDAAALLAGLGVPAYVRHSHTADEGTWWPSTSGTRESWHPLVQATGRNLPAEFLRKAAAADIHVILYHYMKCNAYWAAAQPHWVQRWPDGRPILWDRGTGLSPCSAAWRRVYIGQVVELIEMGADAFFFDEFPGNPGGDWSNDCRALYEARHDGEAMPTTLDVNQSTRYAQSPQATHTHTHTHARTHARTYAHRHHAQAYTHRRTLTHSLTDTLTRTYTRVYAYTPLHICTHARTYTHVHAHRK